MFMLFNFISAKCVSCGTISNISPGLIENIELECKCPKAPEPKKRTRKKKVEDVKN